MEVYPKRDGMGKILIITLSVVLFMGCERAKKAEVTTLNIQLPEAPQASSSGKVSAMAGSPEPTGFSGAAPINCYLVAAGGPEESMSKNKCFSRNNVNTSLGERKVGLFVGAAPAGGTVAIDVPSGSNRSVYVVGFHAPDLTYCRSFKEYGFPEGSMSHPYLLGEKTGLEMKAGETMDLPINVDFVANKVIDCTGPDFPEGNGGGNGPSVEATNIAAEFYHSVGYGQCHPMRVHLYADVAGVQNYNTYHSVTHNISLPVDATMNLTYYGSEADCSSSSSTFSSISLAPNEHEKIVWFKAQYSSSAPQPLTFSSSTGLIWNQNRTLRAVYPASHFGWAANSIDYIEANQCHDIMINAVDSSGTTTAATAGTAQLSILDMNDSPLSAGISIVDNCVTQTAIDPNAILISGTKLRVNFGLKMPAAPLSNFKLKLISSGATQPSETIFNPVPVAQRIHFAVDTPWGWVNGAPNSVYEGDCLPASYTLQNANSAAVTTPFYIQLNANLGMGAASMYLDHTCTSPAAYPLTFAPATSTFAGYIRFPGHGNYNYEVSSPFVAEYISGSFNTLMTPATMPAAKIHAVVESIASGGFAIWKSTYPSPQYLDNWDVNGSPVSSGPNSSRVNGVQLSGQSSQTLMKSFDTGSPASTTVILFKPDVGTPTGVLMDIGQYAGGPNNTVSLGATNFFINSTDTGIPWSASTWYNIALTHDGGTNCTITVQSLSGTPQSYGATCNAYSAGNAGNITINAGTNGSYRAAMFFGLAYDAAQVFQVFNYLNSRYP